MRWLTIFLSLLLMTRCAPLTSAQPFGNGGEGDDVHWYSDYDDDEIETWDGGVGSEANDGDGYAGYESDDFGLDDEVGDHSFSNDDYGMYDSDYDWTTSDEGFDDWFGDSDELF